MRLKMKLATGKMQSLCPVMGWFMQRSQSQVPVRKLLFSCNNQNAKSVLDSNGPIFMPNSRLMQQMLRFDFERYQEDIGDGKSLMDPTVICIPRGMMMYRLGV